MISYEDECCGCPREIGCFGNACPNRNVPHLYCDKCGHEVEELYINDGEQWCEDCIIGSFEKVRVNE